MASEAAAGRERVIAVLEEAVSRLLTQIEDTSTGKSVLGIGISTAGVVDAATGVILDATDAIPDWRGTELAARLEARFSLPLAVENDVKCALLGELNACAPLGQGRVVMLTLGTGLGGAIAEGGNIVAGAHSVAGHFGRMPVPDPRGRGDCVALESLVSGTGLASVASREVGSRRYNNGRAVIEAAAEGDAQALMGLDRFCDFLVMGLEQVYWSLDPDVILIGGGLVEARDHWWARMEDKLSRRGLPVTVRPAQLDNDAGVYGAGALIRAKLIAESGVGADANK